MPPGITDMLLVRSPVCPKQIELTYRETQFLVSDAQPFHHLIKNHFFFCKGYIFIVLNMCDACIDLNIEV